MAKSGGGQRPGFAGAPHRAERRRHGLGTDSFCRRTGPRGEVTGCIGTVADISDRKRPEEETRKLEAQVQHAQRLQSLGILAGGLGARFQQSAHHHSGQCAHRPAGPAAGIAGRGKPGRDRDGHQPGGGTDQPDAGLFGQRPVYVAGRQPVAPGRGNRQPAADRHPQEDGHPIQSANDLRRRSRPIPRRSGRS